MFVWYVVKDGEIVGVITRDEPDTFECRREAKNYPDCFVWSKSIMGWASMDTNKIGSDIWGPGTPPEVVLLANMLRG